MEGAEEAEEDVDLANAPHSVTLMAEETWRHVRITHALCYASVQGLTIRDKHILLKTRSPHLTARDLNVGMSRATHGRYVHFE